MIMLNLGCGCKSHPDWINVDKGKHVRLAKHPFLREILYRLRIISEARYKYNKLWDKNIIIHDLRKTLNFSENSVDVVYHSHLLEHFDKENAKNLMQEIFRVLKPRGTIRVSVPDLYILCWNYINSYHKLEKSLITLDEHFIAIESLIEQLKRKKKTEVHRWMYDKFSLEALLKNVGFSNIKQMRFDESRILNWGKYNLDKYKQEFSLILEGIKPDKI